MPALYPPISSLLSQLFVVIYGEKMPWDVKIYAGSECEVSEEILSGYIRTKTSNHVLECNNTQSRISMIEQLAFLRGSSIDC